MLFVNSHDLSPLTDEIPIGIKEMLLGIWNIQTVNKGGTAMTRPLPIEFGKGRFLFTRAERKAIQRVPR